MRPKVEESTADILMPIGTSKSDVHDVMVIECSTTDLRSPEASVEPLRSTNLFCLPCKHAVSSGELVVS